MINDFEDGKWMTDSFMEYIYSETYNNRKVICYLCTQNKHPHF